MTELSNLALNIKLLRKSSKLTLRQLAERIDVCFTSIYHWEAGTKYPTLPHLKKLCDYFGVKIEDLWK